MTDEKKPKRKYTRRAKPQPIAAYSVIVTVKRGRKSETIYAESARAENGCLVVMTMDGPPPLIERVRYIPLGSPEIEVCQRQIQHNLIPWGAYATQNTAPSANDIEQMQMWQRKAEQQQSGPRIEAGPLEIARQRGGLMPVPRKPEGIVERNADGAPVVTAGFLDGSPS